MVRRPSRRSVRIGAAALALPVASVLVGPADPAAPAALPATLPAAVPAPASAPAATGLRSTFTDRRIARIPAPTAIAFTHDGRMLVASQPGRLRVVKKGKLLPRPAIDLSRRLCSDSERGLLGVAVDPRRTSRYIYVFWTRRGTSALCPTSMGRNPAGAPRNRVSRFTLRANSTISPSSERVLLDGIYSPAGNHNGGGLGFGKDGYLYVATGDGGCDYAGNSGCGGANDAARDRNVLNGKILRITRTGKIPAGNPYRGAGTARCRTKPAARGKVCQETFARGLRNPFRLAFKPIKRTKFRINDVGQYAWEEIDTGKKGADYGWNVREGHCANTGSESVCGRRAPSRYTDPVFDYGHRTGCSSITGGAYVPRGVWSRGYDLTYLVADFMCGKIMILKNGRLKNLATGLGQGSVVELRFGPYRKGQALYYTTYAGGGQVRRIAYTG